MRTFIRVTPLLLAALVALTDPLVGSETGSAAGHPVVITPRSMSQTPQYGTATQSSVVVSALDFVPPSDSALWDTIGVSGKFRVAAPASGDWWKSVSLPNGALIEAVEFHGCDDTPGGQMLFGLARFEVPGETGDNVTAIGATGNVQTPGCALFTVTPEILPHIVDNVHNVYALFLAFIGGYDTTNKAGSFRILYRLQVSEAPAIATFSDVPTNHQFFRFIEALAASGITGGCGAGIYCPENPVTRGQMAAFLSIALGLHFPN